MSKNDGLKGMAAMGSIMLSQKGRSGGGAKSARSALNAAHRVLQLAGAPMAGSEICAHAMGLGFWSSGSATPQNNFRHTIDTNCKVSEGGIFDRTQPGVYTLKKGVSAPLTPADADKPNAMDSAVYVVMVKSERLTALPGVTLPPVTIKPMAIAEFLAPEATTDADKAAVAENAKTIADILKG